MVDSVYAWTFRDPFHSIFIETTTSISMASNTFLILITFSSAGKQIGSYRLLLAFFALCDILTSIGHAVVQPYVHLTTSGFYFFPRFGGSEVFEMPFDTISALFFIATYYQTFLVLAFHFVYRYKTVTRGLHSSINAKWGLAKWMVVSASVNVLYIGAFLATVGIGMTPSAETRDAVPSEVLEIYGVDLKDERNGFTVMAVRKVDRSTGGVRWNADGIISICICYLLIGATASVIVFCIYTTNSILKSANNMLSATTRRMHRQIFNALLIQTAVPCVFSYAPLAVCLMWPFTGISLGALGNVFFLITAIFPSIDAFFVLYFIRSFRAAVILILRLPFKPGSVIEPSETEHTKTAAKRI